MVAHSSADESTLQRRWIEVNLFLLAREYGDVIFDEEALEIEIERFSLPRGWQPAYVRLRIPLAHCPFKAPYPLYLPAGLLYRGRTPEYQYLSGPDEEGFCKFHVGIANDGGWAPSWDAQRGDNLLTYLRTVRHAFTEGFEGTD